jgi:hypothetical protein
MFQPGCFVLLDRLCCLGTGSVEDPNGVVMVGLESLVEQAYRSRCTGEAAIVG